MPQQSSRLACATINQVALNRPFRARDRWMHAALKTLHLARPTGNCILNSFARFLLPGFLALRCVMPLCSLIFAQKQGSVLLQRRTPSGRRSFAVRFWLFNYPRCFGA